MNTPDEHSPQGLAQLRHHLQDFLEAVDDKQKRQHAELSHQARAIARKNRHLIPMRQFLHGLAQCGVHVAHGAMHDPMAMSRHMTPQAFSVQEGESSPLWKPGISLYIDHPAQIEIAISNPDRVKADGLVVITCPDYHPKRYLLQGPFLTVDDAIAALSQFLVATTLRVDRPDHLHEFLARLDALQNEGRSIPGVLPGQQG
jgi:hypothetical protein